MAGRVLWVTLLLAALAGAARETRYQKFLRQHVDYPRTPVLSPHRYCQTMMARRQVYPPSGPCKYTNTFVHAPATDLVAACSQPLDAMGFQSTPSALSLTVCRLTGGNTRPPCSYRQQQLQQYVRVSCQNGQPVHLAGSYTAGK